MKSIHTILKKLKACEPAIEWAKKYDTIEEIVANVQRGDWLLWLGAKLGLSLQKLTLAKARCAKTVLHLMKDERSRNAVEVYEKYGLGKATLKDLEKATADAAAAADAADADAVDCTNYDAYAAYAAAFSNPAAYADYASAYAFYSYDSSVVESAKNKKLTADICREVLGQLIIDKVNNL